MIIHAKVKIIHLTTLAPNQFHNQHSTRGMNLKEQYGKIRLLTWFVIQDIMFFLIKKVFQCILYFREDLRLIFYYFPLKIVNINSPYPFEQLPFKSYDDHFPIEKPQTIKTNLTIPVHIHVPCKVPNRYMLLILPLILHDFPDNYYKYLPGFDGENGITAQKHIQCFENYLDLFEIYEDDVIIRLFSLSLQSKVKSWFKNLPMANISNFQQFVNFFLDRWIIRVNLFVIIEEYN